MKLSEEKRKKISEQILSLLYQNQRPLFTSQIAKEMARDEEFTKKILLELKRDFLTEIKKNPFGKDYVKRSRWRLKDNVYEAYKKASLSKENSLRSL